MGEELAHCLKEGKQRPMRQRPDFSEAKQTYHQLYKEHVESTCEESSSIHPADQTRQSHRQRFTGFEEYTYMVHLRTGWKYFLQQVRLHPRTGSTTIGSRIKVGIMKNFSRFNKHKRTCCRSDSDSLFSCSTNCFSLAGNSQFTDNRRRV